MKKALLIVSLFIVLMAVGVPQATAADTADVTVTVTITAVLSVSVSPDSWPIGAVVEGASPAPYPILATNDGNVSENFLIMSSGSMIGVNPGWTCGLPAGTETFAMTGQGGALMPDPISICTEQALAYSVAAPDGTVPFTLQFTAPTKTGFGGVQHSITVTVRAEASTPP